MIGKKNSIKLSYSFIGLFLLATTLLSIMLFTSHQSIVEKVLKENAYRNQALVSQKQLDFIDSWFHERKKDLQTFAESRAITTENISYSQKLIRDFVKKNPEFEEVKHIKVDGKLNAEKNAVSALDIREQDAYKVGAQGKSYISEVDQSSISGTPTLIMATPVRANQKVVGVLLGTVKLTKLNEIMSLMDNNVSMETYIVNLKGYMLTTPKNYTENIQGLNLPDNPILKYQVLTPGVKKALNEHSAVGEYTNYLGRTVLGSYRLVPDYKWVMVVELNRDEVLQTAQNYQTEVTGATIAVVILGVMPIGIFFTYVITLPVLRLTNMIKSVSAGNWKQRVNVGWSFREIAQLVDAVNLMAEKIERTEEEIKVKQEELIEKNNLLEQLAITDHLTQVYNRRYILSRLQTELAHAARYGEQLTTIMIDLDHFKIVNDSFGHNVGDQALLGVVEVIQQTIRKADILGRWGGEEFILICPSTAQQAAVALAERIRKQVEEVEFATTEGIRLYLTLSMGVAKFRNTYLSIDQDIEDMIIRADKALYRAKNNGRNRVESEDVR